MMKIASVLGVGGMFVALGGALVDRCPVRVAAADASAAGQAASASIPEGQSAVKSLRDGVYSDAQAGRGSKTFDAYCVSCHEPQAFVGPYLKAWNGRTVDGLFESVRNGMPEENPGGLERQEDAPAAFVP